MPTFRHVYTIVSGARRALCIAPGKISIEQFFAIVSRNPAGVGDVWECVISPRRLHGDFASAQGGECQRAMRVRGSAQGRELSLTRIVFLRWR
jgi:hypothetical protein